MGHGKVTHTQKRSKLRLSPTPGQFLAPTGALGVKMSSVCVRDVLLPSAISESRSLGEFGAWEDNPPQERELT